MTERGRFISVEGVDGAGKSTHLQRIAEILRGRGHPVVMTREPGGTPLAEKLRNIVAFDSMDPLSEVMIMFAARRDHVVGVIEPALNQGSWVLCDRFTDATVAYQGGGKGVPVDLILNLAAHVHPGLKPDRTLIFDCPFDIARERLGQTGKMLDRFEREGRDFHDRVRSSYLDIASREPQRVVVVDASRPLPDINKELYELATKF